LFRPEAWTGSQSSDWQKFFLVGLWILKLVEVELPGGA
jgi:hypothetical protein